MTLKCTMIMGDCLEVMPALSKASVQMCFADLPYGVSSLSWDVKIPLAIFWKGIHAFRNSLRTTCLTANISFAVDVISTNRANFRYDLIWKKKKPTGFFNSKHAPLREHELILVFGKKGTYNPQMVAGSAYTTTTALSSGKFYGKRKAFDLTTVKRGLLRYPRSVLDFVENDIRTGGLNNQIKEGKHPTQKPVALLEWLVRTYSNSGDSVLDPVSGSGTTAIAALSCGRQVTCIEKDPTHFQASVERVRKHVKDNAIDAVVEVRT